MKVFDIYGIVKFGISWINLSFVSTRLMHGRTRLELKELMQLMS